MIPCKHDIEFQQLAELIEAQSPHPTPKKGKGKSTKQNQKKKKNLWYFPRDKKNNVEAPTIDMQRGGIKKPWSVLLPGSPKESVRSERARSRV